MFINWVWLLAGVVLTLICTIVSFASVMFIGKCLKELFSEKEFLESPGELFGVGFFLLLLIVAVDGTFLGVESIINSFGAVVV